MDDLLVLCLGMAGGGFYRLFAGIMMCRSSRRQFVFYASRRCSGTQSVGRSQGDSIADLVPQFLLNTGKAIR